MSSNTTEFLTLKQHLLEKIQTDNKADIINQLNPKNLLSLITYTMSIIDKYSKGDLDKKQMCLDIIDNIIENSNANDNVKKYLIEILNNIYDAYVENIILVSKGKFDINKINKIKKFFTTIFCCKCKK